MRQLETLVGADAFRDGLREYLHRFSFGNATWPDLIRLLDDRTPDDLAAWSHAWVDEDRRPVITTELACRKRAHRQAGVHPARSRCPRAGCCGTQHVDVALGYADRMEHVPGAPERRVGRGRRRPRTSGAALRPAQRRRDRVRRIPSRSGEPRVARCERCRIRRPADARQRVGHAVGTRCSTANSPPSRLIELALRGAAARNRRAERPGDPRLAAAGVLAVHAGAGAPAHWRRASSRCCGRRLNRGAHAEPEGRVFFAAAQRGADAGDGRVADVGLGGHTRVPGLTLAETDYIALAQELAAPKSRSRAGRRSSRAADRTTKNPDRKARLKFVMPALSSDPAERGAVLRVARRRRQPAARALGARRPALAPPSAARRGVGASTSRRASRCCGRSSGRATSSFRNAGWTRRSAATVPGAAQTVRAFVMNLPAGYPDRLRRIILSSADDPVPLGAHEVDEREDERRQRKRAEAGPSAEVESERAEDTNQARRRQRTPPYRRC